MCGIVGIYVCQDHAGSVDRELLTRMRESMVHRGPDGGQEWVSDDGQVGLGFRRLAILDLSETAMQPMPNEDGRVQVVFNGEIYNSAELRAELQQIGGHVWRTDHSDTEVIVHAYEEWGIECLKKLRGMFALALYDLKKHTLYLARDRFGQKPLFYTHRGGRFYFASEVRALLDTRLGAVPPINEEAIYHYLTILTVAAPHTFYQQINKVESGTYLIISAHKIDKQQYWNIADYINQIGPDTFTDAVYATESLLETSMRYRNIADVPLAVALSGGLDSSLNLYYAKQSNPDITAIHVAYSKRSEYDESDTARRLCEDLQVPLVHAVVDQNDFEKLIADYLMVQSDMPVGDPNGTLLYGISRIARDQGAKVLIVGEGGDEIGGYPVYQRLADEHRWLRHMPEWTSQLASYVPSKIASRLDALHDGRVVSRRHIHGFTEHEKASFWRREPVASTYGVLTTLQEEIRDDLKDSFLRKILNVEYKLRLPEMILARVDYPSMAASVEARSPFMDHQLIAYSASLPFGIKMQRGPKSVLREIGSTKLPRYILEHPKIGFGMLLTPFLQHTLPAWFHREIIQTEAPLEAYVSKDYLRQLCPGLGQQPKNGYKLWVLYALNRWLTHVAA